MTTHVRLLGILIVVSGLGLTAASAAGGTSNDTWKGAWKFEIPPPRDQPFLTYYDTNGKTVFRFGCGSHYEMDAVYPGSAPKQENTKASITITNSKTQMDFAGFIYLLDGPGAERWPPNTTMFNQPDLGHPELDGDKWGALENRFFDLLELRAAADDLGRGQKLRAAASQRAALAGALPENLLTRRRNQAAWPRCKPCCMTISSAGSIRPRTCWRRRKPSCRNQNCYGPCSMSAASRRTHRRIIEPTRQLCPR